jgi:N,N'-diacetyllegionaminate synthase
MNRVSTIIIAEAGVNHNGSIDIARQLIDAAADAGADYVKFQTFKTELNISYDAMKAEYQKNNTQNKEESQFEMVKKLELSFNDFKELKDYCEYKKIEFLSTGFDFPSIDFLDESGQRFFKIPSGEITNKPYLQYIGRKGKPVIMSTGMANLNEIRDALNVLMNEGLSLDQITLLHCNTEYPTPMKDVNLLAMKTIKKEFGVKVGYSDHTLGIEVPLAAVAMGAEVIEKHFTLDRNLPGPDHRASLEPFELKAMISAIRNVELALSGDGEKLPSKSELPNLAVARKSIHLKKSVTAGEIITNEHLIMKRPGDGISPMLIDQLTGKKFKTSLNEGIKLTWDHIE